MPYKEFILFFPGANTYQMLSLFAYIPSNNKPITYLQNWRCIYMIGKNDTSLLNWIYKHVVDFTAEDDTSCLT